MRPPPRFGNTPHNVGFRAESVIMRRGQLFNESGGLRSWAAARKDAELVPLRVDKYDPAHIALADVGVSST